MTAAGTQDAARFARIAQLRDALRRKPGDLDALRNAFRGETALVLSCGPSLARWREIHDALPSPPLVVCIKQAINAIDVPCHLHFLNPQNLQRYRYPERQRPLQVFSWSRGAATWFADPDLLLEVTASAQGGLESTLAARRDFAAHSFESAGLLRPWGPGIVYESVFYTLLHLGLARVVTAGWDIADSRGDNRHFYDTGTAKPGTAPASPPVSPGNTGLRRIARSTGLTFAYKALQHLSGRRYNLTAMLPGEAPLVAAAAAPFLDWLGTQGMQVEIGTASNWLDGRLTRD